MSLRTSATRYAKALLDVAISESDPAAIERELGDIVGAMNQHADLRRVLTSPRTPQDARTNIVREIAARAGAQPPLAKLLVLLAGRGRLEMLPMLLEVYRERLLAHRNIIRATVTSATPLSPDTVQRLEESLRSMTGKQVMLETSVDPQLIGGVVTRIGSTVYDGSVRMQLQKMKQQLVESA